MPRKRSLEVRLRETKEKMDKLELEQKIRELRDRLPTRRRRPVNRGSFSRG